MAVPPDFVAGQVLTAAQMNAIGLWEVKSQTIGTAVSSVTVTGAFTADYENYKIIVAGGVGSADLNLVLTLGASTTTYYWAQTGTLYATGAIASVGNNTTSWRAGFGTTNTLGMNVELLAPNLAKHTIFMGTHSSQTTTGGAAIIGGYHATATAYTDFTITTSAGTMTGGTIRVYGYRN